MNRLTQMVAAALGAVIGYAVHGTTGLAVGGIAMFFAATYGVTEARAKEAKPSIAFTAWDRKELAMAMHIALAVNWGLRPLRQARLFDLKMSREITYEVYDRVVLPMTQELTANVMAIMMHMYWMVQSDVKPHDSMKKVKWRFRSRIGNRDREAIYGAGMIIMQVQKKYGPIEESRDWFFRWCQEMGIKPNESQNMWNITFGDELITMEQWKRAKGKEAMDALDAKEAAEFVAAMEAREKEV